jgi:hypothetical protein
MIAEVALARVEGFRVLRNPAVWLAFALAAVWATAGLTADGHNEGRLIVLVGYPLVIPGFVIVVHTILATLRSRLSDTDGLLDTVPVGPDRRSVAHGAAALVGFVLASVAAVVVYSIASPGDTLGTGNDYFQGVTIPRPGVAQVLQGPFAVLAMTTFAIALVRWVPSWLVLVPLAFLAMVQTVFFGMWFGEATGAQTWWWPMATGVVHGEWIGCGEFDSRCDLTVSGFDRVTPWWHLAYLAAAAVFFVVVAVLRHRRDRTMGFTVAAALAGVLILGMAQVVLSVDHVAGVGP